jgi:hypothetical protein
MSASHLTRPQAIGPISAPASRGEEPALGAGALVWAVWTIMSLMVVRFVWRYGSQVDRGGGRWGIGARREAGIAR